VGGWGATQHRGSGLASPQQTAGRQEAATTNQQGLPGEWRPQDGGDGDDETNETDEFKLDAAAVAAEEAV
jgi:hypothetical protein